MCEHAQQGCQPSPPLSSLMRGPSSLARSRSSSPHCFHLFLVGFLRTHVARVLQLPLDVLDPLTVDATTGNLCLTEQLIDVTEADLRKLEGS